MQTISQIWQRNAGSKNKTAPCRTTSNLCASEGTISREKVLAAHSRDTQGLDMQITFQNLLPLKSENPKNRILHKAGKALEQTSLPRRYSNASKQMKDAQYQPSPGKRKSKPHERSPLTHRRGYSEKTRKQPCRRGHGAAGTLGAAAGTVTWGSHWGRRYGGCSKT